MSTRKLATIVHLNDFASVTPLVGGYLKAYALQDPEVKQTWDIELYNRYVQTPASAILGDLVRKSPDVIAFSVYTWNVGLVMRLLEALRGVLPARTQYLLGGVEVMHLAERFLDSSWEDTAICNGEGEQTFLDYLLQAGTERPEFQQVHGLSLYRDGALITTPSNPRLRDLMQIPSPWLNGMFSREDLREVALFETNRGCPYACEFCYWGGAIGQRVTKLQLERIKDEITYISNSGTKVLAFCDANVGILPHDVEIAEHVARLRSKNRAPTRIILNSAKNRIDRVEKIAKIYARAGLLSTQAISLQSMNSRALKEAKRVNKTDEYLDLMTRLTKAKVPTFVELIWPMPGETLSTFKQGINDLCGRGAPAFFIHPLQWLNNVGYYDRKEELGVSTLRNEDPLSGTENVICTREVTFPEYIEGLNFIASVLLLYTCRGLHTTMHLLNFLGIARYCEVLDDFGEWMNHRHGDAISEMWHDGRARFEERCKGVWPGVATDCVLRAHRDEFDRLVQDFARGHLPAWSRKGHGDLLRAAVEFDHLSRPYLYLTRKLEIAVEIRELDIVSRSRGTWKVRSRFDFPRIMSFMRTGDRPDPEDLAPGEYEISVDHRVGSVLPLPHWRELDYHWFAAGVLRAIARYEPRCTVDRHAAPTPPVVAESRVHN